MLTPLANCSGKSSCHETAETATQWVHRPSQERLRDSSVAPGLRGKKWSKDSDAPVPKELTTADNILQS